MENVSNITDIQAMMNRQADIFASLKRINANANERIRMPSAGYECPICHNRTYSFSEQWLDGYEPEGTIKLCRCRKSRSSIANLHRSGLTIEGLKEFSFQAFTAEKTFQRQMLDTALNFVAPIRKGVKQPCWLALLGASGSGKTHLCSAVSYELLRHGYRLHYMNWVEQYRDVITDSNFETLLKTVDVLYIDDFFKTAKDDEGKQKPSASETRIAFQIINSRYLAKKMTIISSESFMSELYEIDNATASRIYQMCRGDEYCVNIAKVADENRNYRMSV